MQVLQESLVNILATDPVVFPTPTVAREPRTQNPVCFFFPNFRLDFDCLINAKLHNLGNKIEKWGRNMIILVIFPKLRVRGRRGGWRNIYQKILQRIQILTSTKEQNLLAPFPTCPNKPFLLARHFESSFFTRSLIRQLFCYSERGTYRST